MVTSICKSGYHRFPYHMRSSNIFASCPYSNSFVRYERLFMHGQNAHFCTIFSNSMALFSAKIVTGFRKTDHIVTIDIARNTDLKY